MPVERLDHVNIVTDRLDESAEFYVHLLDLERRDGPPPSRPDEMQWLFDPSGQAIVHLNSVECGRRFDRAFEMGSPTGAVHHVALRCTGFDETLDRLAAMNRDFEINRVASIGLVQIFTQDPNGVLLELNFFAG